MVHVLGGSRFGLGSFRVVARAAMLLGAVLLIGLLLGGRLAVAVDLDLIVHAGPYDRTMTPVRTTVAVPEAMADAVVAWLVDDAGRALIGQWAQPSLLAEAAEAPEGLVQRELHFVLPELAAGQSKRITVSLDVGSQKLGSGFSWRDTPGRSMELRWHDAAVLRYMYQPLDDSTSERREQTYKVFHHVLDPTGSHVLTKGPGGLYTHHRGLFYGFNRIRYGDNKGADVWHCSGDGYQSHEGFVAAEAGPVLGRHRLAVDWHGMGKEVFAHEQRELAVYRLGGGTVIDVASRLTTAGGPITVDGDPQHAGFQYRAAQEVAADTKVQTYYIRPDGVGAPGETRNWPGAKDQVNLPWKAMCFVVAGQRYTVANLDHPRNPKEARFSERDYGRFGSYFVAQLDDGRPLEVRYRFWLQTGGMSVAEVTRHSNDFVYPVKVTVK